MLWIEFKRKDNDVWDDEIPNQLTEMKNLKHLVLIFSNEISKKFMDAATGLFGEGKSLERISLRAEIVDACLVKKDVENYKIKRTYYAKNRENKVEK